MPKARRLEEWDSAPARQLLSPVDIGISWGEVLRFKGLAFASGGKFKACFCDWETLPDKLAGSCAKASDYKVEIGTVHVSGVSYLIEEKKFQRGTCVEQFWGGLRCYPSADKVPALTPPTLEEARQYVPPPAPGTPTPVPTPSSGGTPSPTPVPTDVLSTWCFYGPEEQTRDDPNCKWKP